MNDQKNPDPYRLTEGQMNVLETYQRHILRFLLYQLNDDFQLRPQEESNWLALGYHMIRLLKKSDARTFEMVAQGMMHIMVSTGGQGDPFVIASMAETKSIQNNIFREIMELMREDVGKENSLKMGNRGLGKGELYTTLWNLEVIRASKRMTDHLSLVERAMTFVVKGADAALEGPIDVVARLLRAALHFKPFCPEDLAERCLNRLLEAQGDNGRWDQPGGMAVEGEVVLALIDSAERFGDKPAEALEKWLETVFDLNRTDKLPEWPAPFEESRTNQPPDYWLEGWIVASLAAAKYLHIRRPDFNPGAYLMALSIPQSNILVRAEEMLTLAGPYLPPLPEVQKRAPHLNVFWQSKGPYDKSVNIMWGSNPSPQREAMIQAISETLEKKGLVARHLAEPGLPLLRDPWENAGVYLAGCKSGIALIEGSDALSPELLFQTGVMRGHGCPLLVLWDKAFGSDDKVQFPGVQVPMEGIRATPYDEKEVGLAGLKAAVEQWVDSLKEMENPEPGQP